MCRVLRHPFEGNLYCVHHGHLFPVGNKTLHTLKGGYIVDTLKILEQWLSSNWRGRIISVSFEIYGYSPISPIGCVKVNICYIHREWLNPKVSDNALNLICQKGKIKIHI